MAASSLVEAALSDANEYPESLEHVVTSELASSFVRPVSEHSAALEPRVNVASVMAAIAIESFIILVWCWVVA